MKNKRLLNLLSYFDRKKCVGISLVLMSLTLMMNLAIPGWLLFYKPAFRGRVVDTETGEPVEGVVVVAMYQRHVLGRHLFTRMIAAMLGGHSTVIKARETLTDKNGDFHIPSYVTIISPFSYSWHTDFIIFKPGYGRADPPSFSGDGMERFFSENFGKRGQLRRYIPYEENQMVSVTFGLVRLPKVKTLEERKKAGSISFPKDKCPLLREISEKEYDFLYDH